MFKSAVETFTMTSFRCKRQRSKICNPKQGATRKKQRARSKEHRAQCTEQFCLRRLCAPYCAFVCSVGRIRFNAIVGAGPRASTEPCTGLGHRLPNGEESRLRRDVRPVRQRQSGVALHCVGCLFRIDTYRAVKSGWRAILACVIRTAVALEHRGWHGSCLKQ